MKNLKAISLCLPNSRGIYQIFDTFTLHPTVKSLNFDVPIGDAELRHMKNIFPNAEVIR